VINTTPNLHQTQIEVHPFKKGFVQKGSVNNTKNTHLVMFKKLFETFFRCGEYFAKHKEKRM
jgi:hypothetical protein